MNDERFFADLPVLEDFAQVCDLHRYRELPEDWHIVVADVQNSTGAIHEGLYKAVNILGVSVITAVVNVARPLLIPYVFGGDGASLCIPPRLVDDARRALLATRNMARRGFNLDLRVGTVPVSTINQAGHRVLVARHRVSEHYVHAAFAGGGIEYAEELLKGRADGETCALNEAGDSPAPDLAGLECRWKSVPSRHGETISLIVKSLAPDLESQARFYNEVIGDIHRIYGGEETCRPVHIEGLHTAYSPATLRFETTVRSFGRGHTGYLKHLLRILVQNVIGWVLMTFRLHADGVPWGDYKPDLVTNTDFRKFDGVLRQVLAGTQAQREALGECLSARHRRGECVYGIHVSSSALITCLISKRAGAHFHFVDGADGGYAMAATGMKKQLRELAGRVD